MSKKHQNLWDKIWRDNKGNVVLWQRPNWLLIGWLVTSFVFMANLASKYNKLLFGVGTLFLVAWGVLEVWRGVNYFRRALGGVVLLGILAMSPHLWTVIFK
jgi:hypothetical protein